MKMGEEGSCLLEMRNISKYFSGLAANRGIHLRINQGEIHALLGENGAGKTTLVNILYGLCAPTWGDLYWKGEKVSISSPRDAIALGIGMVHQQFMLIPALTVIENVLLGAKNKRGGLLHLEAAARDFLAFAEQYAMRIDPWAAVSALSPGQRQRLEILKALYRGAELLILDEPAAALGPHDAEELFGMITKLKAGNHTVIVISHKLNEILALCDRVTVLRRGALARTVARNDTDPDALTRLMFGRDIQARGEKTKRAPGETVLEVRHLSCRSGQGAGARALAGARAGAGAGARALAVNDVSFSLRGGEILGIAGGDNSGQREIADAVTGLLCPESGTVLIKGEELRTTPVRDILERNVAHIPEDAQGRGLVLSMSVKENLILTSYFKEPVSRHKVLRRRSIDALAEELLRSYQIKSSGGGEAARNLSGGSRQKLVAARELSGRPDLLVAVYPMRGLDLEACEYIGRRLVEERERGAAVLLFSSDIEEIVSLSDRICVLYEGELMGEIEAAGAGIQQIQQIEQIGRMMAGGRLARAGEGALC
jgi:simple sugar transport system ATP-binding protein